MIARLSVYPRMRTVLDTLPPKLLALCSGKPAEPVRLDSEELGTRVERIAERIGHATFTGAGDKPRVVGLYKDYAGRVATSLQGTLALRRGSIGAEGAVVELLPLPTVDAPAAPPLRLAVGQLLLLLPDADARRAGGEGDTRFGAVVASGRVALTLAGGDVELSLDGCSQAALPWRPPAEGWEGALLSDVAALRSLETRARALADKARAPPSEPGLQELRSEAALALASASELTTMAPLAKVVGEAVGAAADAVAAALARGGGEGGGGAGEVQARMDALCAAVARLQPEALAAAALRASGAVGVRRYADGQWLSVRHEGSWRDAEVVACAGREHRLRLEGGGAEASLALHPWNHAPRELPSAAFAALRGWYVNALRAQHGCIVDALSGEKLDTLQQCVAIDVSGDAGVANAAVNDAHSLAAWLRTLHLERLAGGACEAPCAALLTAGPAAGKTTLLSQVVALSLDGELVPILIKAQRLQRLLLDTPDAFAGARDWVDACLYLEHANERPEVYRMLRQALMARRALVLLDGLDEGGQKRAEIERHAAEVLAPQGHVVLCTSRPAGIDEARFATFRRLQLSPLTDEQQEAALVQRLGEAAAAELMPYVRDRVPIDTETKQRVTANPLMLSMVASVFELRRGVDMPSTVAELYSIASDAMLARSHGMSGELRRLLQAIFFEAHVAQRREIEDWQLDEAVLGLDAPGELEKIRARANPFAYEGRAEKGHYVEVVAGEHAGKRGNISSDDKSGNPYKVTFSDGAQSGWLEPDKLKSSGLDAAAFHARARELTEGKARELRDACKQLPEAPRAALAEVRERVSRDELPLLSLLTAEPLRLQSSHLSFQEYFAACALCEEGTTLSGVPPWQWPAWWANAVAIGGELSDKFGERLLRAAGVKGDALDLEGKIAGDKPTTLRVVCEMARVLTSLKRVPPPPAPPTTPLSCPPSAPSL